MCHIYCTKYSVTFKLPHGKGNECKRNVCMIAPCISDLMKTFYHFQHFPLFFSFCRITFASFFIYCLFISKSFPQSFMFYCFLYISSTLYFRKLSHFPCLYLQVFSFERILLLKIIYRFLALNAFFTFQALYISENCHIFHTFTFKSYPSNAYFYLKSFTAFLH